MTRIAIVGGGRAATLHAQAVSAAPGVDLVGVGGRPGSAAGLAAAAGVDDLPLAELVRRADALIVAVPPSATTDVVAAIPPSTPLLLESPVPSGIHALGSLDTDRVMTAVNLLHAPAVKAGLRAIAGLGAVHHLDLRARALRRGHERSIMTEPFAGVWPVLLAAAGVAVERVAATVDGDDATVTLTLADGRTASARLSWLPAGEADAAFTELEAASATGVVTVGLWPLPTVEIDGRAAEVAADAHPITALGFVEQVRRFAAVAEGRAEPWPPLSVGLGVTALAEAATRSAATDGEPVAV